MFFAFRVAPYDCSFVRGFACHPVDHVIPEVEIIRIIQGDLLQHPVFIGDLAAELLVYAHTDSFMTAPVPILRNRS